MIDYNIYLFDTSSPSSEPVTVTTDGSETGLYNGIPDWVYEGECSIENNNLGAMLCLDQRLRSVGSSLVERALV